MMVIILPSTINISVKCQYWLTADWGRYWALRERERERERGGSILELQLAPSDIGGTKDKYYIEDNIIIL